VLDICVSEVGVTDCGFTLLAFNPNAVICVVSVILTTFIVMSDIKLPEKSPTTFPVPLAVVAASATTLPLVKLTLVNSEGAVACFVTPR